LLILNKFDMETIHTVYLGELRTMAVHVQSGSSLITDAPVDNQGKGEAFSPTDLLAASLGSCMLTIMGIAARNLNFDMDGTQISITKVMTTDPRRVGEIIIDLDFPRMDYPDKVKKALRYAAESCPVAKSLHPDLKQTIHFSFDK
jgi:putative redox protein